MLNCLLNRILRRQLCGLVTLLLLTCGPSIVPTYAQTSLEIHDIMTNLPASPYLGVSVSVSGIVIGVIEHWRLLYQ